ncbi:MAG: phenylalanine--tRNA ligase subunit beta [Dethiobacteria bacterium]|jgi:phenylalanyl-tRNA synthetase beta chain|nr:phenylalanine--tRNA ligase subunit beta [Bacillota bacterium]
MRFSVEWLRDYIDFDLSPEELAEKLTLAGVEVEGITPFHNRLDNVVAARVISIRPHEHADRLTVVEVDAGERRYEVVCGAQNINKGDLVAFALPGAHLPGGLEIKEREIRGVKSYGMLCSAEELGLEFVQEAEGILILDHGVEPGKKLSDILQFDDQIFELDLTPNRADCLGLLGIAYEVAALTGNKVRVPSVPLKELGAPVERLLEVEVQNPDLCPRYTARVIREVNVKPSPLWMQRRLLAVGIRPINNVVDITNYIMWETGQPLHAFDYSLLHGHKVIVRCARPGETLVTLDGVERKLEKEMLVIADAEKAIGVAGVMGGENSEISTSTRDVVLESAFFKGVSIRQTAKKLSLSSDASQRFERGVNPAGVLYAQNRAASLLASLAGGKVQQGVIDSNIGLPSLSEIRLRHHRIQELLGFQIDAEAIETILKRLDLPYVKIEKGWKVSIPLRRNDLKLEVDLIEEIARLHGYEHIPATLPQGKLTEGREDIKQRLKRLVSDVLAACGFQEVITYSFMNPHSLDKLQLPHDDRRLKAIELQNPLSEEQKIMRTTLLPNILDTINYNLSHQVQNQLLFEVGSIFLSDDPTVEKLPDEKLTLALAATGSQTLADNNWQGKNKKEVDFFFLKGALELLFRRLGVKKYHFKAVDAKPYHPTKAAEIFVDEQKLGLIGEVHPVVLDNFALKQKVIAAELDLELLIHKANPVPSYEALPKYPAVLRDIAVVVPKDVSSAAVRNCLMEAGRELIEDIQLFDHYEGEQIPDGYKSLAFAIIYRSKCRTLTDEEVAGIHQHLEESVEREFQAQIRK